MGPATTSLPPCLRLRTDLRRSLVTTARNAVRSTWVVKHCGETASMADNRPVTGTGAPILILTGAATGLVGSILGLGGGVFLVPLLTLALGVPIRTAIAASLVSVIASASASATVNLNRGLVNLRLGLVL